MSDKYCPFAGYDAPCERCMMALRKRDKLFCAFAWNAAKQTHGGRGKEQESAHAFGPWIENAVGGEERHDAIGADGLPIKVGETVYDRDGYDKAKVVGVNSDGSIHIESDLFGDCDSSSHLYTHEMPEEYRKANETEEKEQ